MENLSLPEWTLNLSVGGQAVFLDGKRDDGEVVVEFLLELLHVADVIHALVETAGELGRDGLERNFFVGQRGENDEQFRRRLRAVGFVHRNFGDEILRALGLGDVPVNFPGVLHGEQIFVGDALDLGARDLQTDWSMCGMAIVPTSSGWRSDKRLHVRGAGGFADGVGHVNREEIRGRDETIHRFEADVVGVHVIGFFQPSAFTAASAAARRLAGSEPMKVCSRLDLFQTGTMSTPCCAARDAGAQLRLGLMGKTVAHAQ